jgi:hypothetical protein
MATEKKSSVSVILLAWIVVGLPAGWGIYNTARNSMKLFQHPPTPAAPTAVAK